MNNLLLWRDRFFDFDLCHVTEADKVDNCRFLENCWMEFAENQRKSVSDVLSPPIIKNFKNGSKNLPFFFQILQTWFSRCWYSQLKENPKVTTELDYYRNPTSNSSRNRQFSISPASATWPCSTSKNRSRLFTMIINFLRYTYSIALSTIWKLEI